MEGRGGLKQLEDDHGEAVHVNLQVVWLVPAGQDGNVGVGN
jgi:hypothetical protein